MSKKQPLVSVIMNCYNGEKYLREAIDSVYAQTYKNWEIVFWDNASTDNSAEVAKSYNAKLKYYSGTELFPLYAARNFALDKCSGDAIAFLDCDDVWMPEKLTTQIEAFKKGYCVIYGGYKIISTDESKAGIIIDEKLSDTPTTDLLTKRNPISIGCVLICSSLLKKYRFDDYYELLGDYELWVRLSLKYKISRKNPSPLLAWSKSYILHIQIFCMVK